MKRTQKIKKSNKKNTMKSGFSLIETLIALAVFSIAAVMLSGTFASFLKRYTITKNEQVGAESAQYAMNLMAKTIRSSVIKTAFVSGNEILMFDNSAGKCVIYGYANGTLSVGTSNLADIAACTATPPLPNSPLTKAGEISDISFYGTPTAGAVIGKILILAKLPAGNAAQIQTVVSLR